MMEERKKRVLSKSIWVWQRDGIQSGLGWHRAVQQQEGRPTVLKGPGSDGGQGPVKMPMLQPDFFYFLN